MLQRNYKSRTEHINATVIYRNTQ